MLELSGPIFVGGINRSGTTLTARLLGSHREIAVPPTESLFFGRRVHERDLGSSAAFARAVEDVLSWPRMQAWNLDAEAILARARDVGWSARTLFVLLLDEYRRRSGKSRIGEKSVANEFRAELFEQWLPGHLMVHVVRHPFEVYASTYGAEPDLALARHWARLWRASAERALIRSEAQPKQYRVLRYEDLCAAPRNVAGELCAFVGVDADEDRMVGLGEYPEKQNSSFEGVTAVGTLDGAVRRDDRIDRRALVATRVRELIAGVCGDVAGQLGYELGLRGRRVSPATALQLITHRARLAVRAHAAASSLAGSTSSSS
jgi:hypothetical protein